MSLFDNAPRTMLCGDGKPFILSRAMSNHIKLNCNCRVQFSSISSHLTARIGGKRFHAGERVIPGGRCGSVIIRVVNGKSIYGLAKKFVRVICDCYRIHDFVVVTWLPPPVYPDKDPLTVHIHLGGGVDINTMTNQTISTLNDIQPSRVIVGFLSDSCLQMMRIDGYDNVV